MSETERVEKLGIRSPADVEMDVVFHVDHNYDALLFCDGGDINEDQLETNEREDFESKISLASSNENDKSKFGDDDCDKAQISHAGETTVRTTPSKPSSSVPSISPVSLTTTILQNGSPFEKHTLDIISDAVIVKKYGFFLLPLFFFILSIVMSSITHKRIVCLDRLKQSPKSLSMLSFILQCELHTQSSLNFSLVVSSSLRSSHIKCFSSIQLHYPLLEVMIFQRISSVALNPTAT